MEFLHPKCGGWVGACAMKAQDCEFFTHPPTSKVSQSSPDGKMDVKCRQIKNGKRNHMGRATQIPQSGRTVPSIPLFCEGKKYATSGSWTFVHSSVVICLQFDVFDFGSDVL